MILEKILEVERLCRDSGVWSVGLSLTDSYTPMIGVKNILGLIDEIEEPNFTVKLDDEVEFVTITLKIEGKYIYGVIRVKDYIDWCMN